MEMKYADIVSLDETIDRIASGRKWQLSVSIAVADTRVSAVTQSKPRSGISLILVHAP
jgi:hypothetical protein